VTLFTANGQYKYRLVRAHPLQFGQPFASWIVQVDSDDQVPRLTESQTETFRPSLSFAELQRVESLGQDLPDAPPHHSVVIKD
jgi:hypothetical protein